MIRDATAAVEVCLRIQLVHSLQTRKERIFPNHLVFWCQILQEAKSGLPIYDATWLTYMTSFQLGR